MTSLVFTVYSELLPYKGRQKHTVPFVRKMINVLEQGKISEIKFAEILFKHPQKNIVDVLKISTKTKIPYIDYQKIDVDKKINHKSPKLRRDIKNALHNLHKLNIIYIDLHDDNIGYDSVSKEWRIIDFDASGLCTKSKLKWKIKPTNSYLYDHVVESCLKNGVVYKPWGSDDHPVKLSKKKIRVIKKICKKKYLTKFDEIMYYIEFGELLYPLESKSHQ